MVTAMAALLALVAVVSALAAWRQGELAREASARERITRFAGEYQRIAEAEPLVAVRRGRLRGVAGLEAALRRQRWALQLDLLLEQAAVQLKVPEFVALQALAGLACGVVVALLGGVPVLGVVAFGLGAWLPLLWLKRRRATRRRRLDAGLAELISMLSTSVKAGFGLMQAFDQAAAQLDRPLATEVQRLLHDMAVGSTAEEALVALNQRVGSYDLDVVVTAILIQRQVGGNLSEILEGVGQTIRERERLRGHVRALTAQQRLSALVLMALPLVAALGMFALNADYMRPLITTTAGRIMLAGGAVGQVLGMITLRRMLVIDV